MPDTKAGEIIGILYETQRGWELLRGTGEKKFKYRVIPDKEAERVFSESLKRGPDVKTTWEFNNGWTSKDTETRVVTLHGVIERIPKDRADGTIMITDRPEGGLHLKPWVRKTAIGAVVVLGLMVLAIGEGR